MKCRFCQSTIKFGWHNDEELKRLQLCFTCCYWWETIEWRADGDVTNDGNRVVRVKGHLYIIRPETNIGPLGHGGREHLIRFTSGEEVITHNLWHFGEIPARFRVHLPDNAIFVDTRSTCSCRAKFYQIVPTQTKCMPCVLQATPQRW